MQHLLPLDVVCLRILECEGLVNPATLETSTLHSVRGAYLVVLWRGWLDDLKAGDNGAENAERVLARLWPLDTSGTAGFAEMLVAELEAFYSAAKRDGLASMAIAW